MARIGLQKKYMGMANSSKAHCKPAMVPNTYFTSAAADRAIRMIYLRP